MLKSTKKHSEYWKKRKINWREAYLSTWDHPHRGLIAWMLKSIPFYSLWEVGCGPGANLVKILKEFPGKQLGGSDINEGAIQVARETFKGGLFHVESGDNLLMSDKSVDVILTDMCLIYVGIDILFKEWKKIWRFVKIPIFETSIQKYIREFKRVGRNYVVLVEFHSPSLWKRLKARLGGYHVYDYRKLLEREGYYDIMVQQIPPEFWPGTDSNTEFRHIITAKIPKT